MRHVLSGMHHQHVGIYFSVREEAGEVLSPFGSQWRLQSKALLLLPRGKRGEYGTTCSEVTSLGRIKRAGQVALQDDAFAGAFEVRVGTGMAESRARV